MKLKKIKINNNNISINHNPYIIVEACVNHQGKISIAKKMISAAKKAGAHCIKFQHHIVDEEMLRNNIPKSKNFDSSLEEVIESTNFTLKQHSDLKKLCDKLNIDYLCTPFSIKAADELESIGLKAFKTGSGELTNHPFIQHLAKKGKPMIVSTGMSQKYEIKETVRILKKYSTPFALMHCVSAYPCPYEIMNLDYINELMRDYQVPVGLSCHTPTIYNSLGAVSLGSSLIEKHFTFDKTLPGPDHKSSIDEKELRILVDGCHANFLARGNKRIIHKEEKEIVAWAREAVVSTKDIQKGEKLTKNNIATKRPTPKNNEIPANLFFKQINKTAKKLIKKNKKIKFSDIE